MQELSIVVLISGLSYLTAFVLNCGFQQGWEIERVRYHLQIQAIEREDLNRTAAFSLEQDYGDES